MVVRLALSDLRTAGMANSTPPTIEITINAANQTAGDSSTSGAALGTGISRGPATMNAYACAAASPASETAQAGAEVNPVSRPSSAPNTTAPPATIRAATSSGRLVSAASQPKLTPAAPAIAPTARFGVAVRSDSATPLAASPYWAIVHNIPSPSKIGVVAIAPITTPAVTSSNTGSQIRCGSSTGTDRRAGGSGGYGAGYGGAAGDAMTLPSGDGSSS